MFGFLHNKHRKMDVQDEHREMEVQNEHRETEVQAEHCEVEVHPQLQVYFDEVIAANDEKRRALQATAEAQAALLREQQQNATTTYWYNHERNKATQLNTELQHLRVVTQRLNNEVIRLGHQAHASAPDPASHPHGGQVPRDLEKRGGSEMSEEVDGPSHNKRRRQVRV